MINIISTSSSEYTLSGLNSYGLNVDRRIRRDCIILGSSYATLSYPDLASNSFMSASN